MTVVDGMVVRTVYVDPDVDASLRDQAAGANVSKADLFRRYLGIGIKAVKARPELFDQDAVENSDGPPLILRTVYLNPKLDDKLRVQAFDASMSKNDLIRRYVRIGMKLAKSAKDG